MAHRFEEPSWRDMEAERIIQTGRAGDYITLTDSSGTTLHILAEDIPWVTAELMGEWLDHADEQGDDYE